MSVVLDARNLSRRFGGLAALGLSPVGLVAGRARAETRPSGKAREARAVIFLLLEGGMSLVLIFSLLLLGIFGGQLTRG